MTGFIIITVVALSITVLCYGWIENNQYRFPNAYMRVLTYVVGSIAGVVLCFSILGWIAAGTFYVLHTIEQVQHQGEK